MGVSLVTSLVVPILLPKAGFAEVTIVQVALTTVAWLVTAFVGPQTDRATLIAFYRKVKPVGPGWSAIRAAAGVSDTEVTRENHFGASFLGWISGCALIWSSLFAIGNFLYAAGDPGRLGPAWILTAVSVVSGITLLQVTRRLWSR